MTEYLKESHTTGHIRDTICQGLFTWLEMGRDKHNIPQVPTNSRTIATYQTQTALGWHHFVRGRMAIEWGNAINDHLARQTQYSFSAETWGNKILSINWKYILQLWTIRNKEVKGDSLERSRYIRRQEIIQEELYIQNTHQHLPLDTRSLIDRDIKSLQGMNTSTLTAYLYGAQMIPQSAKTQQEDKTQRNITAFFQRREQAETIENHTQGQHQLSETT
jgi:hypothetical protein